MRKPRRYLPQPARLSLLALNLAAGGVALLFFAWIERSCALPWLALEFGWPWISLQAMALPLLVAWNIGIFLVFGLVHSATAQLGWSRVLERVFPPQIIRTIYLVTTALSVIFVMGFWQNTGVVLWAAPWPPRLAYGVSIVTFWALLAASIRTLAHQNPLEFIGIKQLYSARDTRESKRPAFTDRGLYGLVRHPTYFLACSAIALSPVMTLDRMLVLAATLLYLLVAIPIEERKLVALFGDVYVRYRERVPAIFPSPSAVFGIFARRDPG